MNNNVVGAVVVTYNPNENLIKCIDSIRNQVGKVVIVDNDSKCKNIINAILGVEVYHIFNPQNLGVADALNIGCKYLLENGYQFALLLDQDSILESGSMEHLLQTIKRDKCGLASPQIILKIDNEVKYTNFLVKKGLLFKKEYVKDKTLNVLINITSGSLIRLDVWNSIGQFRAELFIEGVDDEYCLRLDSKGYLITIDSRAKLYQEYGNQKKVRKLGVNWYPTFHSPLRIYYLYRNKILIMKKYFLKQPAYIIFQSLSLLKRGISIGIAETQRLPKLRAAFLGTFDGLCGKRGIIDERKQNKFR